MKKQGFGMLRPMRTRSRRERVDCEVAWRRVRVHGAYAWIANCQSTRTRTWRVRADLARDSLKGKTLGANSGLPRPKSNSPLMLFNPMIEGESTSFYTIVYFSLD